MRYLGMVDRNWTNVTVWEGSCVAGLGWAWVVVVALDARALDSRRDSSSGWRLGSVGRRIGAAVVLLVTVLVMCTLLGW